MCECVCVFAFAFNNLGFAHLRRARIRDHHTHTHSHPPHTSHTYHPLRAPAPVPPLVVPLWAGLRVSLAQTAPPPHSAGTPPVPDEAPLPSSLHPSGRLACGMACRFSLVLPQHHHKRLHHAALALQGRTRGITLCMVGNAWSCPHNRLSLLVLFLSQSRHTSVRCVAQGRISWWSLGREVGETQH